MNVRSPLPTLLASLFLVACGKPLEPAPTGPPPVLLPADYQWLQPAAANQLLKSTPTLGILDVRDDNERNDGKGTLPNAIALPFSQDPQAKLTGMDRNRPWLVYCAIGGRSELVAQMMAKLSFKRVYLLRDGYHAWRAAGLTDGQ